MLKGMKGLTLRTSRWWSWWKLAATQSNSTPVESSHSHIYQPPSAQSPIVTREERDVASCWQGQSLGMLNAASIALVPYTFILMGL